jgi:hypothetical protein
MSRQRIYSSLIAGLVAVLMSAPAARAQSSQHEHGATTPPQSTPGSAMGPGGGAGGMMGMMGQGGMMGMMPPGMMGQSGMGGGMDMPCGMPGAGMMHGMMEMMHGRGGMSTDGDMTDRGGMRVTAIRHLSEDDVRHFFEHWLELQGNDRLKLGAVQAGDDVITADIVTVDDSLVQRFRVDRHSGQVSADHG